MSIICFMKVSRHETLNSPSVAHLSFYISTNHFKPEIRNVTMDHPKIDISVSRLTRMTTWNNHHLSDTCLDLVIAWQHESTKKGQSIGDQVMIKELIYYTILTAKKWVTDGRYRTAFLEFSGKVGSAISWAWLMRLDPEPPFWPFLVLGW